MYYAEETINGVLHCKNSPKGEWIKFSDDKLMTRILELEARLLIEFNKDNPPECDHKWVPAWAHSDCKKCGAVMLGNSKQDREDYGIAANKIFKSMGEAKFYQKNGIYPE